MTIGQSIISISHLGLTDRDLTFITNLFRLGASQLANYQLIPSNLLDQAQVVLINADSAESVAYWTTQGRRAVNCPAVWISSVAPHSHDRSPTDIASTSIDQINIDEADITVARPLVSKKIFTALGQITAPASKHKTNTVANENSLAVLVVDDSEQIQRYLGLKLPQLIETPLALEFADCGESAIEKTHQKNYDLIFLDVTMPGIDGYKTCKAIQSHAKSFVVMLTSNASPFDRIRGTMSGCSAYLTKPPNDERLTAVFRKMLALKALAQVTSAQEVPKHDTDSFGDISNNLPNNLPNNSSHHLTQQFFPNTQDRSTGQ
ncbi:MAG: hypothetical protein COB51_10770 [Moraxellaceae bacterium]|nr:MAG: hypothetical protein COB51_10770 [Moraxellaceae bacterium]